MSRAKVTAIWGISLDCECPSCHEDVNLVDADDFWCDCRVDVCEHDTPEANNLEVFCPECGHGFNVCCEY